MNIKKFVAKNSAEALAQINAELGPDAAILSTQRVEGGIEYSVALGLDMTAAAPAPRAPDAPRPRARRDADDDTDARGQKNGTGPRVVWSQDADILALQRELGSMRSMLEDQMKAQAWKALRRESRSANYALSLLHAMDFEPAIAERYAASVAIDDAREVQRQVLRMAIKADIKTAPPPARGVVVFAGPPGAGKTTAIAKLAAQHVQRGRRDNIALVTTDTARIAAQDQLRAYGRILQVPVYSAATIEEAVTTLKVVERKDTVLVDTGGLSCDDEGGFLELQQLIEAASAATLVLTLPAEKSQPTLRDMIAKWSRLPLGGVMLTRLDEVLAMGGVLSVLRKYPFPIMWCSTGPNVPDDIEIADAATLARGTMRRAEALAGVEVSDSERGASAPAPARGQLISTVV